MVVQITAALKSNGKSVSRVIMVRRTLGAAHNVTRQSVASGPKVERGRNDLSRSRADDCGTLCLAFTVLVTEPAVAHPIP